MDCEALTTRRSRPSCVDAPCGSRTASDAVAEKTGAVMCPASCATRLAAGPMSFAVRVPYQDNALFGAFTDTVYSHLARRFLDLIVIMSVNMVEIRMG